MKKVFSVVALFLAMTISAQSAKLEYNLKKGDKYLMKMSLKQNMAPIMTMDIGMAMTIETVGVKGDEIENKTTFDRVKMDISAAGENVSFDSAKKDEDLTEEEKKMKAELSPIMDAVVYQTMDKTGKSLSVKMVPEIKEAASMMQSQFTSMVFPKEAVKVGSTWDLENSSNGMNMKLIYKVTKITSTTVYADISGNMNGAADAKVEGKLVVDRASGMFSSMDLDVSMNMMGTPMGMTVSATTKKM